MGFTVSIDNSKGEHNRTRYNATTKKVEISQKTLVSSFPGDWTVSGAPWQISGDKAIMDNTTGANNYLFWIIDLNQTVATPVTFRVKAIGENIAGTGFYGDFGMDVIPTYTVGGLGDGGVHQPEVTVAFPLGTWAEQQFSITCNPTAPLRFLYVYLFARNRIGKITVWDLELFSPTGVKAAFSQWKSDVIDLYAVNNDSIKDGSLKLSKIGFFYNDVSNLDDLNSIDHSKAVVANFDYIVVSEPSLQTARKMSAITYATSVGTKVFGYCQLGWTVAIPALSIATMQGIIDRCAANGYYGVFFDMAGYDYSVTRARSNQMTDYAHTKNLKVFGNAWVSQDLLSSTVDVTNNPTGVATKYGAGDWVLEESFYSRSDNTYEGATGGIDAAIRKYATVVSIAKPLGVKVCGLSYSLTNDTNPSGNKTNSYLLATMLGFDGWSYSIGPSLAQAEPTIPYGLRLGSTLVGSITKATPNRWETHTDRGTIWFEATDTPITRASGAFEAISFNQAEIPNINPTQLFEATSIIISWTTSSDKINWLNWVSQPLRYVSLGADLK